MNIKNFYFNNKKIILRAVVGVLAVVIVAGAVGAGFLLGKGSVYYVPQPGTIDFSLFWDAYNQLKQNFINPSQITDQKIIFGAIEGMTNSLGDPYTNFFDPEAAKMFEQDLSGSFNGIGAEIGIKKDFLTIIAPLKDAPAEKAGLKSGDIIAKIDGKDTANMTTEKAVSLIRGPKGTTVTLTILRNGWTSAQDFKIIRDTIKVASIEWSLKNEDVAYIQIYQFNNTLPSDFKTIALEILQSPAKRIVLDLRDNPGGYLDAAQNIAGWFLQSGQTVTIEDFGEGRPQEIYRAQGNSSLVDYPMVVLINQGSASASEILAGALRDNRNVKLIGTKSFGKGSVQEVIDLEGGSFLKVTTTHWLTPNGSSISEVGLTPDIKIDITDKDIESQKDPQLDKALEIIGGIE